MANMVLGIFSKKDMASDAISKLEEIGYKPQGNVYPDEGPKWGGRAFQGNRGK